MSKNQTNPNHVESIMKNPQKYIFLLVVLSVALVYGQEQNESKPAAPWTAQEKRLVDKPDEIVAVLENGLTVILKKHTTAPVAAVRLYVRAGSIYEQANLGAGLSHLFEHLLAGGTTATRGEEESRRIIEQTGAQFNAFTSKAMTCYHLTVPAQHVGTALNLIADWVTRPTFPEKEFEREWGVVQRELEMRAVYPDWQVYDLFNELRYIRHPARYPVIGYQQVLQQITRQQVLDYYRQMYIPDRCVLSIVGDFNMMEMLAVVKKEFADFKRRSIPDIVLPAEPEVVAPRRMVKLFPSMQGPAKLWLGFPSVTLQHEDLYALDTLANIMGEGRSSRLYRVLRDEKQLVVGVGCWDHTPEFVNGTFTITCDVEPNNIPAVETAVWEQIERLQKDTVTKAELERAKRQLVVGHIRDNQTAEQQASRMAEDYLSIGDAHFSDHYLEKMQAVTVEQVREVARKYLRSDKQITLILAAKPLATAAGASVATQTTANIRKLVLDNGMRVLLKRTTAVPLVNFQLYFLGGLLDESVDNNGITMLMSETSVRGTTHYTAGQIADYFDGVGGYFGAESGNNTWYYKGEVLGENLLEAFDIFAEVILGPTFPADEMEKLRLEQLAAIAQTQNSWSAEASEYFRRSFYTHSPYQRTTLGTAAAVKALTPESLRAWHQRMAVGSRAVLAVFGDIDLAAVEAMVRQRFSALPAGTTFNAAGLTPEPTLEKARRLIEPTAKNGATVTVGFPGMKLTQIEDRYPMEVLTEIVGSNNGWLHNELRGAQLVYYAWGYSFPGIVPGFIAATAQCEAEKAPDVLQRIQGFLDKAARGEITEDEVARAKSNRINTEVLKKQTNSDAAMDAALDELFGMGYDWSEGQADRIMAVSLAEVKRVAQKYLTVPATTTIITSQPGNFETPAAPSTAPAAPAR